MFKSPILVVFVHVKFLAHTVGYLGILIQFHNAVKIDVQYGDFYLFSVKLETGTLGSSTTWPMQALKHAKTIIRPIHASQSFFFQFALSEIAGTFLAVDARLLRRAGSVSLVLLYNKNNYAYFNTDVFNVLPRRINDDKNQIDFIISCMNNSI